jgi:hypothetical protein
LYGGFSAVALDLTAAGTRAVSRQGVRAWWLSRHRNGFPDFHHLNAEGHKQFDRAEALAWYEAYVPPPASHWGRGGRRS